MDEEALGEHFATDVRRARGVYFTPAWLVQRVLDAVAPFVPDDARVIDPACGAGAFLAAARARFPKARLMGCELSRPSVKECRVRVPDAQVIAGDALRGSEWKRALAQAPHGFELWLGNPPYNGRSALLDDAPAYARMQALLDVPLAKGQSLRDDFAFFLLTAADRLRSRPGAIAFVTSATLLDAFLYAPLRQSLLSRLALREVVDLGVGAFRGTKVKTCFTVWTTDRAGTVATATPPAYVLKQASSEANALQEKWTAHGEPLTQLVPVSLPGLKTRFDELLTDANPENLRARLVELMKTPKAKLAAFAKKHDIPAECLPKLRALPTGLTIDPGKVRAFIRYRGAASRGPTGFCYVERALIPRGDHRLHGDWDPHQGRCKLVFNVRELPLWAELVEEAGCVTAYQHTRFAPLWVPKQVRAEGPEIANRVPLDKLGPLVPNLSKRGLAWAEQLGGPEELFRAITRFIRSPEVQDVWAPAFGASEELCVPEPSSGDALPPEPSRPLEPIRPARPLAARKRSK